MSWKPAEDEEPQHGGDHLRLLLQGDVVSRKADVAPVLPEIELLAIGQREIAPVHRLQQATRRQTAQRNIPKGKQKCVQQ